MSLLIKGVTKHSELTDVSTPHVLAELVAAVCSETEADGKITTHETGGKHRWTLDKLLKGAGASADPTEIDVPAVGISNVKIGQATRNASGNQVITGVGFQPKIIIFLLYDTGGTYRVYSIGFDDGTTAYCIYGTGHLLDLEHINNKSLHGFLSSTQYLAGYVSALSSDGFTITWSIVGTLEVVFQYLAMK